MVVGMKSFHIEVRLPEGDCQVPSLRFNLHQNAGNLHHIIISPLKDLLPLLSIFIPKPQSA